MNEERTSNKESEECKIKKKYTNTFLDSFQYPSILSAKILPTDIPGISLLMSEWSQRNFERSTVIRFQQSTILNSTFSNVVDIPTVDTTTELLCSLSNDGGKKAVMRHVESVSNGAASKKVFLEIWCQGKLTRNFDLTALDLHGSVYTDSTFSALEWSPCGNKIVYIAEKRQPDTEPFYKQRSKYSKSSCVNTSDEYLYLEEWGEALLTKHQPVVVVYDINTEMPEILEGIPDNISPAKVIWAPSGTAVVGVGYVNTPKRLGLVYCTNRASYIFQLTLSGIYRIISGDDLSVCQPRFSPNAKYLIWLERPCGGPHHAAHRLVKYDWTYLLPPMTVIPIVTDYIMTINGKRFYGLYNSELPPRCWSNDSTHILLSTPAQFQSCSYIVNVETRNIWELVYKNCSVTVLDVGANNVALFRVSSLVQTPVIYATHVPSLSSEMNKKIKWIPLTHQYLSELHFTVDYLPLINESFVELGEYSAIFFGPKLTQPDYKKVPLIVAIHGGPHSSYTNTFNSAFYYFAQLGYATLMVNYHGSTGFGQKHVESLLGKIGTLDISDVHEAVQTVLQRYMYLDKDNVFLFGGSHGGFIITHLISLYPRLFTAVAAINPVTQLSNMIGLSDIPDWAVVESGFKYTSIEEAINKMKIIEKMVEISPVKNISRVQVPTLLLIGKKDLRVPPSQGIMYYHMLKELCVITKLLCYDDNHSLSSVSSEMDSIINSVLWFNTHSLKKKRNEK